MKINYDSLLDIMSKLPADINKYPNDIIKFIVQPDPVMTLSSYPDRKTVTPIEVTAVKNYKKENWDLEFK